MHRLKACSTGSAEVAFMLGNRLASGIGSGDVIVVGGAGIKTCYRKLIALCGKRCCRCLVCAVVTRSSKGDIRQLSVSVEGQYTNDFTILGDGECVGIRPIGNRPSDSDILIGRSDDRILTIYRCNFSSLSANIESVPVRVNMVFLDVALVLEFLMLKVMLLHY